MEYTGENKCLVCGIDLGECNPRQYCCKTYCPMEFEQINSPIEELKKQYKRTDSETDEVPEQPLKKQAKN